MLQIESKISDRRFTNLILNFLKGGYFVFRTYMNNKIGIPHGNDYNISITLGNIFLHQLDGYILSIKKWKKGDICSNSRCPWKYNMRVYLNTLWRTRQIYILIGSEIEWAYGFIVQYVHSRSFLIIIVKLIILTLYRNYCPGDEIFLFGFSRVCLIKLLVYKYRHFR